MADDPNVYELWIIPPDTSKEFEVMRVSPPDPGGLIDAARLKSAEGKPREVRAVVNGIAVATFAGRWLWDTIDG